MEAERGWATAVKRGTLTSLAPDLAPPCPRMHSPTITSLSLSCTHLCKLALNFIEGVQHGERGGGGGGGISTPKLSEWAHIIKGWPLWGQLDEEDGKASKGEGGVKGDWGRHAYSDTRERCLISCLNLPFPPLPNAPIIQRFPSLSWLAFQRKIQTKKLSARRCMASRQKSEQNAFNVAAFWPPENSLCSFFEDFEDKLFLYTKI